MSYTADERQRIADLVRRARITKGLDKEPAARAAGINSITWKRVEDAESVRDASLGKVLRSLGLPDGDAALAAADELEAVLGIHQPKSSGLGRGLAGVIPTTPAANEITDHDEHFARARRLLDHAHESIRAGDHLGAIHGLEGVWSTVELLVDRITDEALLKGIPHADQSSATDSSPAEPDASPQGQQDQEVADDDDEESARPAGDHHPPSGARSGETTDTDETRGRDTANEIHDRFRRAVRTKAGEHPPRLHE